MRERITFIQKSGSALDPSSLKIADGAITGPEIEAAREDRVTFALEELPVELQKLLSESHELHIRWVSSESYKAVSPFLSRLSPGFHLFYTPRNEAAQDSSVKPAPVPLDRHCMLTAHYSPSLCSVLGDGFGGINCTTPAESFTSLPNDRFSHSAAFQFYQPLSDLSPLVRYVKGLLCSGADTACGTRIERLSTVSSLDISYDTISHALKVAALWPLQSQPLYVTSTGRHRTEVGILAEDKPPNLEAHEIGVSGLLTVLGQDSKPSPTLFAVASRHRDARQGFSAGFLDPTGLHPTMQIRMRSNQPPEEDAYCSAHAYLTLPRTIFPDKYQLADDLFMASKNLTALRYSSEPIDLEAPEYVMKTWGSAILLELSPPKSDKIQPWTAEIPLHLRYLSPSAGGYRDIEVPYPAVFWACASEEGTKFPTNPFERVNLGYDGLFGPRTVFWHVEPQPVGGGRLINTIKVPVLDLEKSTWINAGTAIAVLLGFAWVAWKLLGVYQTPNPKNEAQAKAEEKKRK